MPLKNIVRAFALMFATVLSASASDPPTPGTTPLHTAAGSSGVAEVEVLLKAGAYVFAKDADGLTPLHSAASSNPSPAVLEVLLKAGADVNASGADEAERTNPFASRAVIQRTRFEACNVASIDVDSEHGTPSVVRI
ncbi:MAG: hypothetical protein EXS04_05045 [Phycisphaerales bacterium]|nr:hypothetical protein [Phycisphaerales bacterium]